MVVGAMGQMPVLGQLAKGMVLYLPAAMADVPNGRCLIAIQIPSHHPNPVLLFFFSLPLLADPLALRPSLSHPEDPTRSRIRIVDADRGNLPHLDLASLSWLTGSSLLP